MNVFFVISFLVLFGLIALVLTFWYRFADRKRLRKFADALEATPETPSEYRTDLLAGSDDSRLASLDQFIEKLNFAARLEALLQQAGVPWSVSKFVAMSAGLCFVAGWIGLATAFLFSPELSGLVAAAVGGWSPYIYVKFKRKRRIAAFEEQFPESLEFLSRALRAGHAFSVSLELLSKEAPEPTASEFRRIFNEQNLGAPVDVALRNLGDRVPLIDVGFFVSAVLLQRETGGNLTEILDNLSFIIRERFRLKGHVSATSASARMTGVILTLMPIGLAFMLNLVNPGYLETMVEDDLGQSLIVAAVVSQVIGYLVIRKIVDIKV